MDELDKWMDGWGRMVCQVPFGELLDCAAHCLLMILYYIFVLIFGCSFGALDYSIAW